MTINQTINGVSRELIEHAIEALTRHLDQHAPMQVPPSKADSDLVREELRALLDSPYPSEAQLIASGLGYPMSKEDAVKAYKASLVPRTDSSSNADCEWCHGCGHHPYGEPCVGCCKPAAEPQDVPVEWGAPKTVRQLVRQLETLDQDLRPLSMLRVPASVFEDGKERVRATHLSFSHERVDGQWLAPFKSDGEKVLAFWCRMEQPAPITVVHPFAEKVIRKLERFQECADDGQGADIGRHWFDLLTQLGLLNRVQRSPALWEMTQQGEDALELSRQSAKSR